eukprot:472492-Hanusia_phi.AAC.11
MVRGSVRIVLSDGRATDRSQGSEHAQWFHHEGKAASTPVFPALLRISAGLHERWTIDQGDFRLSRGLPGEESSVQGPLKANYSTDLFLFFMKIMVAARTWSSNLSLSFSTRSPAALHIPQATEVCDPPPLPCSRISWPIAQRR